jgi:hypothetical protein
VLVFLFCRVLRLSDCVLSADCLASVGSACPSLKELRYRTASASYSPERVTARSELVYNTHIMRIVQGAACTLSACALVISAICCRLGAPALWLHLHCHEQTSHVRGRRLHTDSRQSFHAQVASS